ncbi:dienelactone hydrolase family protein [Lentzea tibetensis]|uniref:dienelactone hydrolase family protein n=1 Tax=Lentzea tibetensis TaxID=2591470 RepID=UPI00164805F6|nr:dienelactone hydrolase family protein [Lentzea tibetensis]
MSRVLLPSGTEAILVSPAEPVAGLVLLTDIFGLRPLFDELCTRLAEEWNVAVCAPDPYPGIADPGDVTARLALAADTPDSVKLRQIGEAADATGCARQLLLGFCQGGGYAYKAAADVRYERLVSFYGPVQPGALDALEGNGDRLLALVGWLDPLIMCSDVRALDALGVTVVRYYEASHGFAHDSSRPAHRPADAADAFRRAREWLKV